MTEPRSGRWSFGLFLIVLGIAFFLHFPLGHVIAIAWPVVLVLIGLSQLTARDHRRNSGLLLILLGALFLALNLGFFAWHVIGRLWPLVLITIGASMLLRARAPHADTPYVDTSDSANSHTFFGAARRVISAQGWTGGTISAVFGGLELDLRGATLAPEGAVLSIDTVFGGVKVFVPSDWDVRLEGSPIFGGMSDSRLRPPASAAGEPARPRLTIKATALFGGVEVTS